MNTFKFDGSWNQIKGVLRQKYAQFTDDDLAFTEGKGEELLGRLQTKLGLAKDAVIDLLHETKESLSHTGGSAVSGVSAAAACASEFAGDVKDKLTGFASDACGQACDGARSLRDHTERFVAQQPLQALLTAVAVGFVAGFFIRR